MKHKSIQNSNEEFNLQTLTTDTLSVYLKNQLPSIIGKYSLRYIVKFLQMYSSSQDHKLKIHIEINKRRPKIVPYLAMIALVLSNLKQCSEIVLTIKLEEQGQVQKQIPQTLYGFMKQSPVFTSIVISFIQKSKDYPQTIGRIFQFLTCNCDYYKLKLTQNYLNSTTRILSSCKNITQLSLFNANFNNQQYLNSFKKLNLQTITKLSIEVQLQQTDQQNQKHNRLFYGILESMVELGTLELSIHNSLPRELITAIGKLKYIDTLRLKNKPTPMTFQDQDLYSLLEKNVFLSEFNVDFSMFSYGAKYLYRLIRQRKRVQERQMMSISAMQSVSQDMPLQAYMIVNILEMQKIILL